MLAVLIAALSTDVIEPLIARADGSPYLLMPSTAS